MRRLVSSAAALEADRRAETDFGYPPLLLMEEAGIRLQDQLEKWTTEGKLPSGTVVYLAGAGNNGGDALVMARQAYLRGRTVSVVRVFPPSSPSCRQQNQWIERLGVPVSDWPSAEANRALADAAVWVDGLWGTGLNGPVRDEREAVLRDLEALRARLLRPVVAVDVPSGLGERYVSGAAVLRARFTLSPGWAKDFCFYPEAREAAGEVVEVPLAFPVAAAASAELVEASDLTSLLPAVAPGDHKSRRGHVALVGAAAGMTGALVLAARSAAAAGAGLVSLGVDAELIDPVAGQVPSFQVRTPEALLGLLGRYDALVVGPGWGRTADRPGLLSALWGSALPLVVDADGLTAWKALAPPPRRAPVVFTPHPGEFARLGAPEGHAVAAAAALARTHQVTIVLKGAVTWVLAPDGRRAVWDGANPALGTGGSGDCLAGVVGALLARGLDGFEAARAAVALHGEAGRRLAARVGWFTADQLPEALALTAASCMAGLGPL
jgi:NAD(P)H-hydrate epimerase